MRKTEQELLEWIKMNKVLNKLSNMSADEVLKESGQYNSIPVNIKKVLDSLGIKFAKDDFEFLEKVNGIKDLIEARGDICGLVLADDADVKIIYKKNKNIDMNESTKKSADHRAKFTLAHELAHCCLHAKELDGGYVDFRCNQEPMFNKDVNEMNTYEKNEYEANIFAGELLIPKHSLDEIIKLLKVPSLYALVTIFEVSANVMKARLSYLQIEYVDDIF